MTLSSLFSEWLLRGVAFSILAAAGYLLLRPGGRLRGALLSMVTIGLLILPFAFWTFPKWATGWFAVPMAEVQNGAAPPVETGGLSFWFAIWLAGAVLFLSRIVYAQVFLSRQLRGAHAGPIPERIAQSVSSAAREFRMRAPKVIVGNQGRGPFAAGLFRPVIVLPPDATGWNRSILRAVFLHELAHLRRRDLWFQFAGNLACALYWFNPVVWFIQRRLAREREYLADAFVIETGADPRRYAHALLDVAGTTSRWQPAAVGVGLGGTSALEDRIRRLLGQKMGRCKTGRFHLGGLAVLALSATVASACLDPFAQPPEAEKAAEKEEAAPEGAWTEEEIERRLSASPFPGS